MQLGLALPFGDIGGEGPVVREFWRPTEVEDHLDFSIVFGPRRRRGAPPAT